MSKEYNLWKEYGTPQKNKSITLGPHTSFEWNESRRQLIFTAVRYKFAAKLIGNIYDIHKKDILELGCSDGYGTHFVAEYAKSVLGVDFDDEAIRFAQNNAHAANISFLKDDFLGGKEYGKFDGIVSFDVIEHIYPENVNEYMKTVIKNLKQSGTFIVGTPSMETQQYSSDAVQKSHVNVYKGEELYHMLRKNFYNVYLFTQNDEVIHTGHNRMANYLIAVCSNMVEENENFNNRS